MWGSWVLISGAWGGYFWAILGGLGGMITIHRNDYKRFRSTPWPRHLPATSAPCHNRARLTHCSGRGRPPRRRERSQMKTAIRIILLITAMTTRRMTMMDQMTIHMVGRRQERKSDTNARHHPSRTTRGRARRAKQALQAVDQSQRKEDMQ